MEDMGHQGTHTRPLSFTSVPWASNLEGVMFRVLDGDLSEEGFAVMIIHRA